MGVTMYGVMLKIFVALLLLEATSAKEAKTVCTVGRDVADRFNNVFGGIQIFCKNDNAAETTILIPQILDLVYSRGYNSKGYHRVTSSMNQILCGKFSNRGLQYRKMIIFKTIAGRFGTNFGDEFDCFPNLAVLKLRYNEYKKIPSNSFYKLTKLLKLDMSHNKIADISYNAFRSLGRLRKLVLSNNQLYRFADALLYPLHNLTLLDMSHNRISFIHEKAFQHLTLLQHLDLSSNSLPSISRILFQTLRRLAKIDLSANALVDLYGDEFYGLDNLTSLSIQGNALRHSPKLCQVGQFVGKNLTADSGIITYINQQELNKCIMCDLQHTREALHGMKVKNATGYYTTCNTGYSVSKCMPQICQDTDECLSSPCLNGGTCLDQLRGYNCINRPGFTGKHGETDIDECHSAPCQNGGGCRDQVNGFICDSPPGFTGKLSEINIDECLSSPCFSTATCIDQVNGYTCKPHPGFTGAQGEIDIDECMTGTHKCSLQQSECANTHGSYRCNCAKGIQGKHCNSPMYRSAVIANQTSTSITIKWDNLTDVEWNDNGIDISKRRFVVELYDYSLPGFEWGKYSETNEYTVTGLYPGITYALQLSVYNRHRRISCWRMFKLEGLLFGMAGDV